MNQLYFPHNNYYPIPCNKINQILLADFVTQSEFVQKEQINNYQYSHSFISFEHSESSSFQPRIQTSIIVQKNITETHCPVNIQKPIRIQNKSKVKPKQPQKQSRNVASNLLRIFLKHVLQLHYYESTIDKIILRYCLDCTCYQFYEWIESFGINYKNYIRLSQVKKMFNHPSKPMKAIFIALIQLYIQDTGITHCLTSRRIDRNSTYKHLQGLRQLVRIVNTK